MIRNLIALCLAISVALTTLVAPGVAATRKKQQGPSLPLIRDAEIEGLLRLYTKPLFTAAGLKPSAIRVYIIKNDKINAFVADGQRLFVHTGLLSRSKTPNELIGVLAHETGHIAGGHLARMGIELDKASTQSIVGMLIGVAAVVGGAASGQQGASQAGQGIMMGSQGFAQRGFLSYQRSMEASADQAALKYLNATGQSTNGMLSMFQTLANESLASLENADPYLLSHPMPLDRIRNLEIAAKKSAYFEKPDKPEIMLRHELMQAKLSGFLDSPQLVFQRYPSKDNSLPARYARSIAMFRKGDTKNAIPLIDSLIKDLPQDPYFWELKGQAYLEGGQPAKALAPLKQASKLLPNNGLIQILYAQALIATENKANAKEAVRLLTIAKKSEPDSVDVHKFSAMGYALLGDIPRAELATAQAAMALGDTALAAEKAKIVMNQFKHGTPEWFKANDIVNFTTKP